MPPKLIKLQKSRGAALVLAMLIVAMVTAISVELTWRFDLGATRSGNRWHGMQAGAYLEGAEALAKIILRNDLEDGQTDSLGDEWAQESPPFPTDEGWVRGTVEDAAGRLNLNSMLQKVPEQQLANGNPTTAQRFTASQRRFIRLLQTIPVEPDVFLDEQTAVNMADAVIDWIDQDSNQTGFGGAESDYYGSLDIPYTISNKMMVSVSELRIIKGLNELPQSFFEALYPLVIALPEAAKLNVNTAPVQVLRSLNRANLLQPLSPEEGQSLLEERGLDEKGFQSADEFVEAIKLTLGLSAGESEFDSNGLAVSSSYFIFSGETQVGDRIRRSRSILERAGEEVTTMRRTDANF